MTDALDLESLDLNAPIGPLDGAFNAADLMAREFPPVEYVVPGVIPEGLTLLVAAPKVGKSWLCLALAHAASTGGRMFGTLDLDHRPVLYLALEDGPRRLQDRLRALELGTPSRDLTFIVTLTADPVRTIAEYLAREDGRRPLVILDTLGKVRPRDGGNDQYGRDYAQMSALKQQVDHYPGASLIVVHHTNKGGHGDFLEAVSGTQGLAGAADSILVLVRERNSEDGTLKVTSRDAVEGEYALTFHDAQWWTVGTDLKEAAQAARERRATAGLGDSMSAVINAVQAHPEGIGPVQVMGITELERSTVDKYLSRAVESGRIVRTGRGQYAPVPLSDVSDSQIGGEGDPFEF